MTNTTIETVLKIAEHQKQTIRTINIFFITLLVLSPFIVYFLTPFKDTVYDWSADAIQNSIQEGYFWIVPGDVLLQLDMGLVSAEDPAILASLTSFIIAAFPLFCLWVVAYIFRKIINRKFLKQELSTTIQPVRFLPFLRFPQGFAMHYEAHDFAIAQFGDSIVLQTSIGTGIPETFVDSREYSLNRTLAKRIIPDASKEVVLDGTSFEAVQIYSTCYEKSESAHFFNATLMAIVVKQLSFADICIADGKLTVFVPAEYLARSTQNIQLVLSTIATLHNQLEINASQVPTSSVQLSVPSRATRLLALPKLPMIPLWLAALLWCMPILFYSAILFVFYSTAKLGMAIFIAWLLAVPFLIFMWNRSLALAGPKGAKQ